MPEIQDHEARVNVTYGGQNGDLPDPVTFDAGDGDVKQWVTEAVRTGGIPAIGTHEDADFTDFVVDRFTATEERPYNAIFLRPKTPFGDILPDAHDEVFDFVVIRETPRGNGTIEVQVTLTLPVSQEVSEGAPRLLKGLDARNRWYQLAQVALHARGTAQVLAEA